MTGVVLAAFVLSTILLGDFLAVNRPLGEDILVVEGGMPKWVCAQVPSALRSGHYRRLVVLGHPAGASDMNSWNDVMGTKLESLGYDTSTMVKVEVPFQSTFRSYIISVCAPPFLAVTFRFQLTRRTYASALAFSEWLRSSRIAAHSVDVFTGGVHARKSWILYRHAIGGKCRVGIIAAPIAFNSRYWLLSREGIYQVPRNLVGYLYAKFLILFDG